MLVLRRKNLTQRRRRVILSGRPKNQSLRRRNPLRRVRNLQRRGRSRRRTPKSRFQHQSSPDPPQSSSFPHRRNGIPSPFHFLLPQTYPRLPRHKRLHSLQKQHLCMPPMFRIIPPLGFLQALLRTASSYRKSCSQERYLIG